MTVHLHLLKIILQHPAKQQHHPDGSLHIDLMQQCKFPITFSSFKEIAFISKKCDICHYL